MWPFESRWKVAGTLFLILSLAAFVFATSGPFRTLTWPEAYLAQGLAPLQSAAVKGTEAVRTTIESLWALRTAISENRRLKTEMESLRAEVSRLEELGRENAWLRDALAFRKESQDRLIPAEVIARPPGNWLSAITIDKGSRDGVRPGTAVVTPTGVVGQVRAVTKRTASVLLITDTRSAVGGVLQRTGDLVLVEGMGSWDFQASVKPLNRNADVRPGDRILTSGLSQIYPKNLSIGQVVQVAPGKYGLSKVGILMPGVDLGRLTVVFVVPTSGTVPERNSGGGDGE